MFPWRLSVCLFVSRFFTWKLLNGSPWQFYQRCMDQEEPIKFWQSSTSTTRSGKFLKDSLTFRERVFLHKLAHICGKTDQVFMKILSQMYLWTDSDAGPNSPWRRFALSQCFCFGHYTNTISVLCTFENSFILQSIWNPSLAPPWQFRL